MYLDAQWTVAVAALPLFLAAAWYLLANHQQMERPRRMLLALSACGLGWFGHTTAARLQEHVNANTQAMLAIAFGIATIICLTTNTLAIYREKRYPAQTHRP